MKKSYLDRWSKEVVASVCVTTDLIMLVFLNRTEVVMALVDMNELVNKTVT